MSGSRPVVRQSPLLTARGPFANVAVSSWRWCWRLVALVIALAMWQLVSARLGESIVPAPLEVAQVLSQLVTEQSFWNAVWSTIGSALAGLGIAAAAAIPLGLIVGSSQFLQGSTRLSVDFLRTIPPVTLIPLAVLLYGPSPLMKIVLIVFGCVWPLFLQATYAVREIDPLLRDFGKAFGLNRRLVWSNIIVPSSTPFLVTGMRVASTIALLLAVAGELIGNAPGIGREMTVAQMGAQVPTVYAYVLVAALLGVAINLGAALVQPKILFWHPSVRGEAGA